LLQKVSTASRRRLGYDIRKKVHRRIVVNDQSQEDEEDDANKNEAWFPGPRGEHAAIARSGPDTSTAIGRWRARLNRPPRTQPCREQGPLQRLEPA